MSAGKVGGVLGYTFHHLRVCNRVLLCAVTSLEIVVNNVGGCLQDVSARISDEPTVADFGKADVDLLNEILNLLRTAHAAGQEPMQFGAVGLSGSAREGCKRDSLFLPHSPVHAGNLHSWENI